MRWFPSPDYTWRDLHVFVKHSDVDSHVYRALFPDSADWTLTNQLLASLSDIGNWFVWVRQGHEGDPPKRITRPGVVNDPDHRKKGSPMPLSEAKKVYAEVGPGGSQGMTDQERYDRIAALFKPEG